MQSLDDEIRECARILIVDDDLGVTQLLETTLRIHGFKNIRSIVDSRGVGALFIEYQPDLVLLDLEMPHIDGFQILDLTRPLVGEQNLLPILIISANRDIESRCRALSSGAIDFLQKPFVSQEVALRVSNLLKLRHTYINMRERNRLLESVAEVQARKMEDYEFVLREAQLETITRLARAAEHHDTDTAEHTRRVGTACALLGKLLDFAEPDIAILLEAAALHDIGKIGIPDSILLKPGKFTEAEFKIMQRHCKIGANLLAGGHSELLRVAEKLTLTHHEKWDGTGYPRGLHGTDIDINGRILACADVFDALTHERPYKVAWPMERALEEIEAERGRHFDPTVVEAFLQLPHESLL